MRHVFRLPWRAARAAGPAPGVAKGAGGGLVALHAEGAARWTAPGYAGLARQGFMRNPVAHRCIRLISEAASSVPWVLSDGRRALDAHPLLALLARPNPRQTGADFVETLTGHLLLAGNAYVEGVSAGGRLRELHLLRPDRVAVVEGPDGWPAAFDYTAGGGRRRIPAEPGPGRGPGLLHMALFHPLDDHLGFAPLEAALMALDLANTAASWNKALLDNSARPSGALVYQPREGGNLTEAQYARLKEELEEGYSGARRAGRPMLLEGGLDWKTMGLSPREMDFAEAKNGAARDIALALGVPPMLLGIPGDNTYANYTEANRAFYRLTVLPLLARTAAALGNWLTPVFGASLRLAHDTDAVAGLAAEREALWNRVGAASFLTDAEKREAVGYQPLGPASGLDARGR